MTNAELIQKLENFPKDVPVVLCYGLEEVEDFSLELVDGALVIEG